MATRKRRWFTADVKRAAVKLAEQPGWSLFAVARELGVEGSVLKRWMVLFAAVRYENGRASPLKSSQRSQSLRRTSR